MQIFRESLLFVGLFKSRYSPTPGSLPLSGVLHGNSFRLRHEGRKLAVPGLLAQRGSRQLGSGRPKAQARSPSPLGRCR